MVEASAYIYRPKQEKLFKIIRPITIKDIAKALGLSTSTVSRAFTRKRDQPRNQEAGDPYAEQYNYRPNPIALSLKKNAEAAPSAWWFCDRQ